MSCSECGGQGRCLVCESEQMLLEHERIHAEMLNQTKNQTKKEYRRKLFQQVALRTIHLSEYSGDFVWSMHRSCEIADAILEASEEFAKGKE